MRLPSDPLELCSIMARRLDGAAGYLDRWDALYAGTQPNAWLSPASLEALGDRLSRSGINYPRLAVLSLVERLRIVGFRTDGAVDRELWADWTRSGMDVGADTAHADCFIGGRSYVVVWANDEGDPLITAESARSVTTITDPATRRPLAGLKRWFELLDQDQPTGVGWMTLFLPDRVLTFSGDEDKPVSAYPPAGGAWYLRESLPNPTGVVPVATLLNGYGKRIMSSVEGESELEDIEPLVAAISKTVADACVTSEAAARPRRWATGLELIEKRDADGNPVLDEDGQPIFLNPFSSDATRVWQAESEGVKFGQFPQADLSNYVELLNALREGVSAVSTLPAHYLGITSAQPPSAEGLRAAEASLVSRSIGKIRGFTPTWARVGQLATSIRTGRHPDSIAVEPLWSDPSTRSPSQESDEAAKMGALGVPLPVILSKILGWTPDEVSQVQSAQVFDQLGEVS